AAIRAGQLGLRTILIERDPFLGGTCLHRGCIPTKALLHSASVLDTVRDAASFGVKVAEPRVDLDGVHRHKNKVVKSNAKGIEFLMKKYGVAVLTGTGRLAGKGRVVVSGEGRETEIEARNVIVATGSAPRAIPSVKIDGTRVVTSDELLEVPRIPRSLIVLGAGAVGVEFATVFNRFGTDVTL